MLSSVTINAIQKRKYMKKYMLAVPVISGAMWGSAGIFVRGLYSFGFDNNTVIFFRIMVAAVILGIGILAFDRKAFRIKASDIWLFAVCGAVGIIGLNLCYNEAITRLTLSLAAVLLSLTPVFVMLLASVILKEKMTVKKIVCTVLAVLGCALVSGVFETGAGELSVSGMAAGTGAAVFYALYSIFSKMTMKRGYNVFTITFYSMLTGVLALSPFADWKMMGDFITADSAGNIAFIVINALCTSVFPYVLYTLSLSYVDTGKVSILASGSEPAAAMIFGIIFYAEMPTLLSVCGLMVTIAALWILCRPERNIPENTDLKDLQKQKINR